MNDPLDPGKTCVKPGADFHARNIDDKTRLASHQSSHRLIHENTEATVMQPDISAANSYMADKTRYAPQKDHGVAPDKTRFAPARKQDVSSTISIPTSANSGSLLKHRFILEELLGAGGMGVVYKAKDLLKIEAQDRDPYVAIKVLTDEFKSHPEAFIALQRESRKTQRIAHPNIVTVFDFDRDGDTVFMTMEYLDGKPLDKLISQYRSIGLPQDEVYKILQGICAALIYAHAQNIIHSDFKPGNIFVNTKGLAKVIDFGIARAVAKVEHREESTDDKTVFDAGNFGALTPAYASLEMLEGKSPDIRDDIYALGCIAYELYTGAHPFNRVHADEAKRQKLKPKRIPGLKKNRWKAIEQALAFERNQRTPSVDIFWEQFSRKRKSFLGLMAFLLFFSTVSAGGYYQYIYKQPPTVSEDQVRNEIERQLRLELMQKSFRELFENPTFSSEWEEKIWNLVKDFRKIEIENDQWLPNQEQHLFTLYVNQIKQSLKDGNFESAKVWLGNSTRYGEDQILLVSFEQQINEAIENENHRKRAEEAHQHAQLMEQQRQEKLSAEQQKKQDQERKKNSEFDTALENVNQQLSCRNSIDIKDFEIAISKLRSLNQPRYQHKEAGIVQSLASCIQKIGFTFPDRAEVIKRQVLQLFAHHQVFLNLVIASKDPCNGNLAGLGARGLGSGCKDKLTGATKVPLLVVVPAKGAIKSFAIGKYEISNDEMNEYCRDTKYCDISLVDPALPSTNISTVQMNNYVKWLSEKSGYVYRLPNINEWQYATRATDASPDPNRNCKLNSRGIQKGGLMVKASLGQQNSWGLVNHLGNAKEIVMGRDGSFMSVGGSYETDMTDCTFNNQQVFNLPKDKSTGFRILRELKTINGG